ncbi:Imm26 family immunity protein [Undibacterium sp. Di27W]|uniref:Imm26 family immunity protein n=1 Tax=Undibacterium sp. Di27W TaxID=3413036 RepID=UPI003BF3BA49
MSTNMLVLKRTRRQPKIGDIFAYQLGPVPDKFYFGRVIATDAELGNCPDVILIYLYKTPSSEKTVIPELLTSDLLVPPIGTNKKPWTMGYFEFIENREIFSKDRLVSHCFYRPLNGRFYDEYANELPHSIEPVGIFGLSGLGAIDDEVSDALRVPKVAG